MKYMSKGGIKTITIKGDTVETNTPPQEFKSIGKETSNLNIKTPNKPPIDQGVPESIENTPTMKKGKIELKPWQKISLSILISVVLLGGLAVSMYYYIFTMPVSPFQIITIKESYLDTSNSIDGWNEKVKKIFTELESPNKPRTEENPLNGKLFTKEDFEKLKKNRPVAVMMNNHVQARPQSGLNQADIVYESVAESGISRYMPIYWSEGPNKVGPIRSARQYHLEWLSPYDPLYIHDGCASSSDSRVNACGNIYSYAIKDLRTTGYWRTTDRFAPHNEYNSIVSAWDNGLKNGWGGFPTISPLKFKRDAEVKDRGSKSKIVVRHRQDIPNGGLYDSEWTYDSGLNSYLHRIGGQADLDQESGKQVNAKVVVVMEVPMQSAGDAFARVIFTTVGEGKAIVLQDGKIITGKWKKTSRIERERFYDSTGKELEINRGRLWIIALPKDQGKFDIIEQ
jgi:hypothetical protein